MGILPSRSQWKRWTLPSKAGYFALWVTIIGVIIGVFVTVFLGKSATQLANSNVTGDVVGRDKIVYQPTIALPEAEKDDDGEKRIQRSKIKINRFIDDFAREVESIQEEYQKENERIASSFSSRGVLQSGMHIKAQMDYARSTKDRIEKLLRTLTRNIEDILFENFGITALEQNDNFEDEASRLVEEKERVTHTYKSFENTVKNWGKRCSGGHLTKDFRL